MPAHRQYVFKILAVAILLSLLSSVLIVGWLYRKTIEHEKLWLNHLARLHAQHLHLTSQTIGAYNEEAVAREFFSDRFQEIIASHKHPIPRQTGQITLVRLLKNKLVEIFTILKFLPHLFLLNQKNTFPFNLIILTIE